MQQNDLFGGFLSLLRRKKRVDVGAQFERIHADRTVETAKVLSVMNDLLGIPHVRYALTIKNPQRPAPFREGPRLLALQAFSAAYRVRVGS
jgi:hypothetical protein